jgi:hypothetical protein
MRIKPAIMPVAAATCLAVLSVTGPSHAHSSQGTQLNHVLVDKIVVASDRHGPTLPPSTRERRTAPVATIAAVLVLVLAAALVSLSSVSSHGEISRPEPAPAPIPPR